MGGAVFGTVGTVGTLDIMFVADMVCRLLLRGLADLALADFVADKEVDVLLKLVDREHPIL